MDLNRSFQKYALVGLSFLLFSGCGEKREINLLEKIETSLIGDYNNFQQCWQENTKEDKHRVKVEKKHRHIHTRVEPLQLEDSEDPAFLVSKFTGREEKIIERALWKFSQSGDTIYSNNYLLSTDGEKFSKSPLSGAPEKWIWQNEGRGFIAFDANGKKRYSFIGDTLQINLYSEPQQNDTDYQLLRCRYFSGWIEFPMPGIPDSTFRMADLKIHDQGGIIPLILEDGAPTEYSIELTQLVYGKWIAIMKLAVYEQDFETVDYNSKAISYTWTNPEAKRIGINLRKIVSGWTFIEPGFKNTNTKKE